MILINFNLVVIKFLDGFSVQTAFRADSPKHKSNICKSTSRRFLARMLTRNALITLAFYREDHGGSSFQLWPIFENVFIRGYFDNNRLYRLFVDGSVDRTREARPKSHGFWIFAGTAHASSYKLVFKN